MFDDIKKKKKPDTTRDNKQTYDKTNHRLVHIGSHIVAV